MSEQPKGRKGLRKQIVFYNVEYMRAKYQANAERLKEYAKKRYQLTKEKRLIQLKDWRIKNKEKHALLKADWIRKHKFYQTAMMICHRKNIPEKIRGRAVTQQMALSLMAKWKSQRGLCALSGRKLDRSAHVDHILPVSRGGTNEPSNLQWLDPMINQAKSSMTDSEFVQMCLEVVKHNTTNGLPVSGVS